MSLESFPPEILLEIFSYLSFRELVRIERTNIAFRDLIRDIIFEDELVKLDKNQIKTVLTKYELLSIDLSYGDITDEDIEKINNLLHSKRLYLKKLNLEGCNRITDEGLKSLSKCVELNLTGCYQITDKGLKNLSNCKKLNLAWSEKITDEGLKSLSHCTELNLAYCKKITDEGLKYLSHCMKLDLSYCDFITNEGLKSLSNCRKIDLWNCRQITDEGLKYLSNCTELNLTFCNQISNGCIYELQKRGVKVIY